MKTPILTLLVIASFICFGPLATAQEKASANPGTSSTTNSNTNLGNKTADKPASTSKSSSNKAAASSKSTTPSMQIGSMKRDDFVPKECGCAYYNTTSKREDGPLLLWINQQGSASVKVDGRDRKLKVIKEERVQRSKKPTLSKIGVGDRVLMTLKGDTLSASVVNIAERNCSVGAECSHFTWQSTLNLSENDSRKSMKAWAICGCPGRKIFNAEQPKIEG